MAYGGNQMTATMGFFLMFRGRVPMPLIVLVVDEIQ